MQDTTAEILALSCLASDILNAEALYSRRNHQIIASIHRVAPSRCRSSLWKFRSTTDGFSNHLLLAYNDCRTLCCMDLAALLPPAHPGHLPLNNEAYSKCNGEVLTSIEVMTDYIESSAKIFQELETVFISKLSDAGGLASPIVHVVFPSFIVLARDLPALFTKLVQELQETASCYIKFARSLLEFHRGVRDFAWATPSVLLDLHQVLRHLDMCIVELTNSLFFAGVEEDRSTKWLKYFPNPPITFVPYHLQPTHHPFHNDDDDFEGDVTSDMFSDATVFACQIREAAAKKVLSMLPSRYQYSTSYAA